MRLINTQTLELEEFVGSAIPKYAILSHTWEKEEVTFQEWHDRDSIANKAGYKKIVAACEQAREDRLEYLWVDTNCIDKRSSSELSEAINSMFAWYAGSDRCYVYLADLVPSTSSHTETAEPALRKCRWFSRGWTLQEFLAPKTVIFFDLSWQSVSARISWAAHRETTREEDIAYCLLGIFEINMPLLYREGRRAFLCLQEEVIRVSNDQTIFCWNFPIYSWRDVGWDSVLAPHPHVFSESGKYSPDFSCSTSYSLTNNGLEIALPAVRIDRKYFVALVAATMG
ncbi:HET-domain-containing protein [Xylaria digitata]|nr:HET-domain-containing protein [Xylaria digitata]